MASLPEVGAQCGSSARWDLCGGRRATGVPTATETRDGSSIAWSSETARVTRVVDGDTLVVNIAGQEERVRLIGVDTPETVHPQKPVEYFGKEASAFTKGIAEGQSVRLEADPQNTNRDKYRRLLRYVYLPDGRLLNAEMTRTA